MEDWQGVKDGSSTTRPSTYDDATLDRNETCVFPDR